MANQEKMRNYWTVIGRGFNGWHASSPGCSSSGGDIDPMFGRDGYLAEAQDGALVYDASESDADAFTRHVMSGPMLDCSIDPEAVDKFSTEDRETALRMAPGLSGGYKTIAVIAQSPTFNGLDRVGVAVFERLLWAIPGIKIGRVVKGSVVWQEKQP